MTHKTLEQLAREAGVGVTTKWFGTLPDGTNQFLGASFTAEALARFRALCMEEAAQIAEAEFVGESLHDETLCQSDVAYNMALKHSAAAIREAAKQ